MKLGFWNRLAIVVGGLGSVIGASMLVVSENYNAAMARQAGYDACSKGVGKPGSDLTFQFCHDTWLANKSSLGLYEWAQAVGAFALVAAVLYLLVAFLVWLIRWVLAGRQQKIP